MKPTIALFLYDPNCSVQSGNGVIRSLQSHYNFKIFSINPLEDNFFDEVDMIVVPGGFGDASTFDRAFKYTKDRVKTFVNSGGKYLGICMGAYWAGSRYFDLLINADVIQYIKRPHADVRRSYGTVADVTWRVTPEKMYFYDGCCILGEEEGFKIMARYTNNDPMAIIQGRIGLIGCHLEASKYWYEKPWQYIEKYWHGGRHHGLLLDFVNELTEKRNELR